MSDDEEFDSNSCMSAAIIVAFLAAILDAMMPRPFRSAVKLRGSESMIEWQSCGLIYEAPSKLHSWSRLEGVAEIEKG